jgi:hypothetical protein
MFCSKCGVKNPDEAKFCAGCGAVIGASVSPPQPPVPPLQPPVPPPPIQPTYQQPPIQPQMPAVKPKKKRHLLLKILIVIIIFIIAVVGLAMFATQGLVTVVENHLSLLKKGDFAAAYQQTTSKEFQNTLSQQEFQAFVQQYPFLLHNKSHSLTDREFNNNVGKVKGQLIADDGSVVPILYILVKENGQWRIISFEINPKQ